LGGLVQEDGAMGHESSLASRPALDKKDLVKIADPINHPK
jgi:hypothetical protein